MQKKPAFQERHSIELLLKEADVIGIDTEFLRRHTYWPQLCLVQIAINGHCFILDPFEDIEDILRAIATSKALKVLHSARQDIEALFRQYDLIPRPIFDTQIAADFLGMRASISYAELVETLVGAKVNKKYQVSDWSRRPLSTGEKDYALSDVRYLMPLYQKLRAMLAEERYQWVLEESNALTYQNLYWGESTRYFDEKLNDQSSEHNAHILKHLSQWRERFCRIVDLHRGAVIGDQELRQLGPHLTYDKFLPMHPYRDKMYAIYQSVCALSENSCGAKRDYVRVNKLKNWIREMAKTHKIPMRYFGGHRDIENLIYEPLAPNRLLSGWRGKLLGAIPRV